MRNAPAALWNEIADSQTLRTGWAEQMFPLPDDLLAKALDLEEQRVAEQLGSPLAAAAYLVVMPLLWEGAAIQRWVSQNGPNPALPPVQTVDAAMQVAMGDYPLTPDEAQALRALLLVEPT